MTKRIAFLMALVMLLSILTGCAGTTVVVGNCTCPTEGSDNVTEAPVVEAPVAAEGALKTGLAVITDLTDNANATADSDGQAKFDVTFAAVTVDANGVIQDCIIDSLGAAVTFNAEGALTSNLYDEIKTKNELGEAYGMKAYAGSKYEWNEQAAAVAAYAVGKTAEDFKNGAVNESGKAKDADLASTATIYIGTYVDAIVKAVENAQDLGAAAGDTLKMAVIPSLGSSTTPDAEKDGTAQLDCDFVAMTMNGEAITSCYIDSLQAKQTFNISGEITSDISAGAPTKNELGEAYGMKAYAGAKYEWNEQAANFAAYVTGKTAADVAGIVVNEKFAPADADLAAGVTIAIGGFQALIAKAAQ